MECNQVAARRAIEIAERKISENDYIGAKKIVIKARTLYPNLDGLEQVLMMIDVYISASNKNKVGGESDWYGVLGVDPLADDETVKRKYKKLAFQFHPDKNKRKGAEGAFKLVLEAWSLLSDKAKRAAYDQNRKSEQVTTWTQKPTNPPHKPASSKVRTNKPAPVPTPVTNPSKGGSFWTMCSGCKTQCEYLRDRYLNKAIRCPNCGQTFIATEKTPSAGFVMPVNFSSFSQQQRQQRSAQNKATNKTTNAKTGQKEERSSVSFTCSFPKVCSVSVSVTTSHSTGNATNKSQARSKRVVHEESQETLSAAENVRKKLRRDVR